MASRGDGGHVSASQLHIHAETLEDRLEAVLATGFPDGDPVVSDVKKLVQTLGEMRNEVRQQDSPTHRYIHGYYTLHTWHTDTQT